MRVTRAIAALAACAALCLAVSPVSAAAAAAAKPGNATKAAVSTGPSKPAGGSKAAPAMPVRGVRPSTAPKIVAPVVKFTPPPKPAPKPARAKPKPVSRSEAELSGLTSEMSDQFYARVNLSRTLEQATWRIRGSYGIAKSRTYSKNKVNVSTVDTFSLDTQYRIAGKRNYRFVSATANLRTKDPYAAAAKLDKSGYHMVAVGFGKAFSPGLEGELSLASIRRYEDERDQRYTLAYAARIKRPISSVLVLDGDATFVDPWSSNALVDSRVNLSYKITPAFSLRCTYIANNMLRPVLSKTGWDKSFRVALVFSKG